jgi:FixJ family two-component response regulator
MQLLYSTQQMKTRRLIMIDDDEDDFLLLRSAFIAQAPWVNLSWFDSPEAFLCSRVWDEPIHLLVFDRLVGNHEPQWQLKLRRQIGLEKIPLVIHSGSVSPGDERAMLNTDAVAFLEKGVTSADMRQVVNQMLRYMI